MPLPALSRLPAGATAIEFERYRKSFVRANCGVLTRNCRELFTFLPAHPPAKRGRQYQNQPTANQYPAGYHHPSRLAAGICGKNEFAAIGAAVGIIINQFPAGRALCLVRGKIGLYRIIAVIVIRRRIMFHLAWHWVVRSIQQKKGSDSGRYRPHQNYIAQAWRAATRPGLLADTTG